MSTHLFLLVGSVAFTMCEFGHADDILASLRNSIWDSEFDGIGGPQPGVKIWLNDGSGKYQVKNEDGSNKLYAKLFNISYEKQSFSYVIAGDLEARGFRGRFRFKISPANTNAFYGHAYSWDLPTPTGGEAKWGHGKWTGHRLDD